MIFQKLIFNANKLILNILPVCLLHSVFDCLGEIIHVARHTFATLALSNGVSLESVSKMMGHTSIRTTQVYAHAQITNLKVKEEMELMAGRLKGNK